MPVGGRRSLWIGAVELLDRKARHASCSHRADHANAADRALPVIAAGNRGADVVSEAELLRKEEFRDSDQVAVADADVHPGEDLCESGDDTQGAPERRWRPPDGSAGTTSCAPDSTLRRHPRRARGRQAPTSAAMRSSQWTVRSHQRSSSLWS